MSDGKVQECGMRWPVRIILFPSVALLRMGHLAETVRLPEGTVL